MSSNQSRQQPSQQVPPELKKGDKVTFCTIARCAQYDALEDNPEGLDFRHIQILAINGNRLPQPWDLTAGIANKPADLKLPYNKPHSLHTAQVATPPSVKMINENGIIIIRATPLIIDGSTIPTKNPTRDDASLAHPPELATATP